ncbi:MAG: tyrosine-type recombinase/integrase [Xenococcaceae cyanobacterium MO_234.B1]|nr:tyrosine-type recombinase/integrase [Xenococcaceae cyanobacterium MO_234.B1]
MQELSFTPQQEPELISLDRAIISREKILSPSDSLLLDEIFAQFLGLDVANGNASPDTISNYQTQIKLFFDWCIKEQINPLQASQNQIKEYRHYLAKKYKTNTTALKLSVVRRFYDACIQHGLINSNPAAGVKPPVERVDPATRINYLELEEVKSLLGLTEGDTIKLLRDRVIIGLMMLHGLRTVEVQKLNLGHIKAQGETKSIIVASKRAQRRLKLRVDFQQWLDTYLSKRKRLKADSPMVTSLSGNNRDKRLSRDGLRRIVNGYLEQAGLRSKINIDGEAIRLSNHALRHTFATQVYGKTKDLLLVQRTLGHANPRTTAKYAHVNNDIAASEVIDLG